MIYFTYGKWCVTSNPNKALCSNISGVVWDQCELNLSALNCSVSKHCAVLVVSHHYLHDKPDDVHKLHTTRASLATAGCTSRSRYCHVLCLCSGGPADQSGGGQEQPEKSDSGAGGKKPLHCVCWLRPWVMWFARSHCWNNNDCAGRAGKNRGWEQCIFLNEDVRVFI